MAQTKKQRSEAAKKAARTRAAKAGPETGSGAGTAGSTEGLTPPVNRDPLGTTPTDQAGPVLIGHFATVTKGDHKGSYGVVTEVIARKSNGYPETVLFRTRDAAGAQVAVPYADLEPDVSGGRR